MEYSCDPAATSILFLVEGNSSVETNSVAEAELISRGTEAPVESIVGADVTELGVLVVVTSIMLLLRFATADARIATASDDSWLCDWVCWIWDVDCAVDVVPYGDWIALSPNDFYWTNDHSVILINAHLL